MRKLGIGNVLLAGAAFAATNAELEQQVRQAEIGFAKSMADRDHKAFISFLAPDSVFVAGPLRVAWRTGRRRGLEALL